MWSHWELCLRWTILRPGRCRTRPERASPPWASGRTSASCHAGCCCAVGQKKKQVAKLSSYNSSWQKEKHELRWKQRQPTGFGEKFSVLFGQEKSRIWLLRRTPEGVTMPLPNGLFRELRDSRATNQSRQPEPPIRATNQDTSRVY